MNGIVLLSSILNYNARSAGLDNKYLTDFPSFAAIAWYHNGESSQIKPANILDSVEQAREFRARPLRPGPLRRKCPSCDADAVDKIARADERVYRSAQPQSLPQNLTVHFGHPLSVKNCWCDQNKIPGLPRCSLRRPRCRSSWATILKVLLIHPITASPAHISLPSGDYLRERTEVCQQGTYNNSGPGLNPRRDWKHRGRWWRPGLSVGQQGHGVLRMGGDLGGTPSAKISTSGCLRRQTASSIWKPQLLPRPSGNFAHMGNRTQMRAIATWGIYYPAVATWWDLNVDALRSRTIRASSIDNAAKEASTFNRWAAGGYLPQSAQHFRHSHAAARGESRGTTSAG